MAFTGTTLRQQERAAPKVQQAGSYVARLSSRYEDVEANWEALAQQGAALPFQRRNWLAPWWASHNGAQFQPVLVTVLDQHSQMPVMALPLTLYKKGGLRTIGFADAGLTDYNAPIIGHHAPQDKVGAAHAMAAICAVLPPADVLHFAKMPDMVGPLQNPLALLPQIRPSSLIGNVLHVPGSWDDWHWGLERTFRKELERSLRVFLRADKAAFRHITEGAEIARVYGLLKTQQRERIGELGLPYILDEPVNALFYDRLLHQGTADGTAILTALMAGDEVVAALLGIADGEHYAMVRLSTAGSAWKGCSPGRLLIERTMQMLHGQGYRKFDFTIGDYPYKRRMGVSAIPLREAHFALSLRGMVVVARERVRSAVRTSPRLRAMVQAARRRWQLVRLGARKPGLPVA